MSCRVYPAALVLLAGAMLTACEPPLRPADTALRLRADYADASSTEALTDWDGLETPAEAPAPAEENGSADVSAVLTFFTNRTDFEAEAPELPVEDFEEGNVTAGGVRGCPGPLSSLSNDACFATGTIQPGIVFNSSADHEGNELALIGPGFAGAPSKNIVANFFVDAFVIDFTAPDVTGVGLDLVAYFSADNCHIEIFGATALLGSTTAVCNNAGTFWGVISGEPIRQIRIFAPTNQAEGVDNIAFGEAHAVIEVVLDIKPGSDPNSINPQDDGVIPVAVLTTSTAAGDERDFDASEIDVAKVAFGPGGAGEVHGRGHLQDVDGDGDLDLVLHFDTQTTGLSCGDTEATLTGKTAAGRNMRGTDAVNPVPCPTL